MNHIGTDTTATVHVTGSPGCGQLSDDDPYPNPNPFASEVADIPGEPNP